MRLYREVINQAIGSLIAHRPMPTEVTDAGETL